MLPSRALRRAISSSLLVCLLASIVVLFASPAYAAVSVSRAEFDDGGLRIEGTAAANRTITVDGVAMGASDGSGRFRVERSNYTPPADCTVDVNDGTGATTAQLSGCTVTEAPPPPPTSSPSILPEVAELGPGNVGAHFAENPSSHVNFGNGAVGPVQWEVIAGALPNGLQVVPHDPAGRPVPIEEVTGMQIQGTPTTVQTSTFTLRATDANGATATRTYTIRIEPARALVITPDVPQLFVGEDANLWFRGGGGVLPYRWAVSAGVVPTGMQLITTDTADGELVRVGGTPTVAGTFEWTMQLTDAQGTTTSANISVTVSPARGNLSSLTVSPATVTGGSGSTGTVTLDSFAPDVTTVALSSSNSQVASVPTSVTLQPGDTSASFPISTSGVSATTPVTISGSYAGVTVSGTLTVNPSATSSNTVSITRAQHDTDKRTLRVEASSSAGGATLRVYVTSTNALIGTLSAGRGSFSVAANPQNITVRSSLGGSASRAVTLR